VRTKFGQKLPVVFGQNFAEFCGRGEKKQYKDRAVRIRPEATRMEISMTEK
jgi:hypothetical protein